MTATLMTISSLQAELNQELRDYAEEMGIIQVHPTLEDAIAAVNPHFPELISAHSSAEALLEELGFVIIRDMGQGFGPKRVSWSIAISEDEAHQQLQTYQQNSYQEIREALGIDFHWIFLVPRRDLFLCSMDELISASGGFRKVGKPICWVVNEFQ